MAQQKPTTSYAKMTKPQAQPHGVLMHVDTEAQVLRLQIPFDTDARDRAPVSSSGKSRLLATTRGALDVHDADGASTGITISINAMIPVE